MRLIDSQRASDEVRHLLQAATESVCVQCNAHKPFIYSQPQPLLPLILREVNSHLQLLVILGVLESDGTFYPPVICIRP